MFNLRRVNFRSFLQYKSLYQFSTKVSDPYKTLQISRTNNQKDIKNAFYAQTKQYHPDKNPDFKQKYKQIIDAYELLQNLDRKAVIDKELDKEMTEETKKQDPLTRWLYKDYNYVEKNDGTQIPPHILKQSRKKPKNKAKTFDEQIVQLRRFDRMIILFGIVGLYFWIDRIKYLPKSRKFSQEEEDEMVRMVEAKRKAKVKMSEAACARYSIEELSNMEKRGEVILPYGTMKTVNDFRDVYERDLDENALEQQVEEMEMSSKKLDLQKIQQKIFKNARKSQPPFQNSSNSFIVSISTSQTELVKLPAPFRQL